MHKRSIRTVAYGLAMAGFALLVPAAPVMTGAAPYGAGTYAHCDYGTTQLCDSVSHAMPQLSGGELEQHESSAGGGPVAVQPPPARPAGTERGSERFAGTSVNQHTPYAAEIVLIRKLAVGLLALLLLAFLVRILFRRRYLRQQHDLLP